MILLLHRLGAFIVRDLHAAVLARVKKVVITDPVFVAQHIHWDSGLGQLKNLDDLPVVKWF